MQYTHLTNEIIHTFLIVWLCLLIPLLYFNLRYTEDFLIPSACLNATVSGLISRTVLNDTYIGPNDFHGVKYYKELEQEDLSNFFVDEVTDLFPSVHSHIDNQLRYITSTYTDPSWQGLKDIQSIQNHFEIDDINLIKPESVKQLAYYSGEYRGKF